MTKSEAQAPKNTLQIPPRKRFLPWAAGILVGAAIWAALLFLTDASGTLSLFIGFIVGFNAASYVAAGIARPVEEEEEGFFLSPHKS